MAASLDDAFGPSVSMRIPTVLPLRLAAQDAMAMGTPSWLLGHPPWQKSQSLSGLPFDSSTAIARARSFLSLLCGRLASIAKRSEGMDHLTHGPCLKLCTSRNSGGASLVSLVSAVEGAGCGSFGGPSQRSARPYHGGPSHWMSWELWGMERSESIVGGPWEGWHLAGEVDPPGWCRMHP
jgi:hypothetical protein